MISDHFGKILLGRLCEIIENNTIIQGVLIKQNISDVPVIGNQVWIGANAVLVVEISVGNYSVIAPGVLIHIDVTVNSLVIGNPCIINSKSCEIISGYIVSLVHADNK